MDFIENNYSVIFLSKMHPVHYKLDAVEYFNSSPNYLEMVPPMESTKQMPVARKRRKYIIVIAENIIRKDLHIMRLGRQVIWGHFLYFKTFDSELKKDRRYHNQLHEK